MKLTVVIPCYNEVENVKRFVTELIPDVRKFGIDFEIIVVDDGSVDGTAEAVKHLDISELRIVNHPNNQGLGAALRTGFKAARGELVVTIDADLTFAPKDIRKLLDRYELGGVDFVIGSHGLAGYSREIPRWRVGISRLANLAYSLLAGRTVRGISSVFRLYRTEIIRDLPLVTSGYETSVEIFFRLLAAGYRFAEVPTPLGLRQFGRSKLNYPREVRRHLRLIYSIVLGSLSPRGRPAYLRSWAPGLVAAAAIGIIYFLPNALVPAIQRTEGYDLGNYHPLSLNVPTLDELASYGSRIREVVDGHLSDGDAYLSEYKGRPTMWGNSFLATVIGVPIRLLGVRDPTPLFVFGDAVFPALVVLVWYGLLRGFMRDRWVAAAASFAVTAFPNLSAVRFGLSEPNIVGVFDLFARIFDPAFSRFQIPAPGMVVFVGFLWSLFSVLRNPSRPRVLFAGILLGLTYPTYFYYGAFSWISIGLLAVGFLASRSWQRLWPTLRVMMVGVVFTAPSIVKMIQIRSIPHVDELVARVGLEIGRIPRLSATSLVLVALLVSAFWVLGRRMNRAADAAVLSALLVATIVAVNLQLIVGYNIQPDHWGSRVNVYVYSFGIMVAIAWAWEAARKDGKTLRTAALLAAVFFFGIGLVEQTRSALINAPEYVIPGDVQQAFRWIDRNVPRDAVIVSPSTQTAVYIPFFTHINVYFAPSCYTLASNAEVRSRWLELVAAFGIPYETFRDALLGSPDFFVNPIRAYELDPSYMLFCDTYTRYQQNPYVGGDSRRPVPPEVAEDLLAAHQDALSAPVPSRLRFAFRADYVFFGPSEKLISTIRPERYENLTRVYENPGVAVYRID
ncbi:hypothetical protein A2704_04660 [Candidatus Kaiserbacteria bacterium RIFCSPHIGHO2_01_FULL_54_36b]|uniref:Glycosyltransferase 2-like domain-containing protein n=1 Tax=Candidatus Kaiserbacteria bacterium RIFCSPHIGHO2_01_FULL_54_36b TaxID=1798483 RepID=A0A1F6CRF5_9BACT|nr:MAG: hypothetical protein A2704_04660 [Candidatus Kaiserbacteria bacterium RIFCSPHIGHO2_01_FULL_54_36b]